MNSDNNTAQTIRKSNFEALRIICMLFIIAGHIIMAYDFKSQPQENLYECFIRPFFMVAVNCFVLISGWFGIKYNLKKLLSLNNCTTFWAIILGIVAILLGIHPINLHTDILMLFPVITKKYWFITIYVVLCIIAPYLNILVEHLDAKRFQTLLLSLVLLFVVLPTVGAFLNFPSITADSGYGLANFVTLYLLGRYMYLYKKPQRPAWLYFGLYLILVVSCGIIQLAFGWLMGFQFTTLISYDTAFVFLAAIMLFCCFAKITFYSRMINLLATYCLATYIIHMHPWMFDYLFNDLLGLRNMPVSLMPIALVLLPIIIFLSSSILEQIRITIFSCCKRIRKTSINEPSFE